MCTLTIIPCNLNVRGRSGPSVRVVCNRDESRSRPAALPPRLRHVGNRSAFMPVDPISDGTWIAVSDAGLVFVLLNVNVTPRHTDADEIGPGHATSKVSRGRIIPQILRAANLHEAHSITESMDHRGFEPFRLVVADQTHAFEYVWTNGRGRAAEPRAIEKALFFTSSGLGDEMVAASRRRLFDEYLAPGRERSISQDSFHRHVWSGNERVSVWMTREDALTVSRTEVEILPDRVLMNYHARVGDSPNVVDFRSMTLSITGSI